MAQPTVGILSPGDMGHAVGRVLREHGLTVLTCLAGRSARTRELAAVAGFEDRPSLEDLVRDADILLSILVPSAAAATGDQVASAVRATGTSLLFADCNAIAPSTTRAIGAAVTEAGAR